MEPSATHPKHAVLGSVLGIGDWGGAERLETSRTRLEIGVSQLAAAGVKWEIGDVRCE